jgi:adenosylmethionine-8-amino-7-oxononanoate aminotransferase
MVKKALLKQIDAFEHVIFANTTHEGIVSLSQKLVALMPHLGKVFYAGDGSSAVEVALKMSLHARMIRQEPKRTRFIALKNGYHGETLGALSVSDLGLYKTPYEALLFPTTFIEPLYVSSTTDSDWDEASTHWAHIEAQLAPLTETATAIILEPILQGAGGMKLYSQDFLKRLAAWAKANGVHLIADEIMTGMGRTGKMLASMHAEIMPDLVCLSKGLTSGWMPFSAVLTTNDLYDIFYDDHESGKAFLHSHTYSGHALGACIANAVFEVMEKEQLCTRAASLEAILRENMTEIANKTGRLQGVRAIGGMVAADLITKPGDYRAAFKVFQKAINEGVLLRPLGDTLYWLPPLNITEETLQALKMGTERALMVD